MTSGVRLAVVVVSGVAAGLLSVAAVLLWLAAAVAAASAALLCTSGRSRAVLLLTAAFLAAGADGGASRDAALAPPLLRWFRAAAPDGRLAEPVVVRGRLGADAAVSDTGIRLLIDVESIRDAEQLRPIPGRIQAYVSGELAAAHVDAWTAGRTIEVPLLPRELPFRWNPGGPDARWHALHRRADLAGTIKSGVLVRVWPGRWWDETAARIRRRVRASAVAFVAPESAQSAAVVRAILIGDRAGLAEDVERRLRAAGTYHVIAISGGNVAILTAICFVVFRVVIRSFRALALITIVMVVTYGWIVGDEPSVRRAVTAAVIYLTLSLAGLRPRALDVLCVTALFIAVTEPLAVLDPGAWLSFGASLGIILGATRFLECARRPTLRPSSVPSIVVRAGDRRPAGRLKPAPTSVTSIAARAIYLALLGLFSATVAAELALLPIGAALFGRVGALGLVLNFVAIPAMTVVQLAGIFVAASAGWWDAGAAWAGHVAHLAASALIGSSAASDAAPWLIWRVPPSSLGWTTAYYAGLAGILWIRRLPAIRRLSAGVAFLSLVAIVTAPALERAGPPSGRLRVTMLDVGQGDAIAVQFPDGHALLVDAGGGPGAFDVGGRVVTPALWALGIRKLDWLALTHPDLDHVGGALTVARDLQPREIWEGVPVPPNGEMLALRQYAHDRGIAWREVLSGHALELGSVVVDVLHPPAPEWERRRVRNDDSLVLRIRFGLVELLLTGDAGVEFERRFHPETPRARLRLLKVGHHGSRSSGAEAFVKSVDPQVALVSVGRANLFGHPAPDVLARYERQGAILFRTDRDGAVIVETDGASVEIRTMSGRRWRLRAVIQN